MIASREAVPAAPRAASSEATWLSAPGQRPSFRWSDIWKAPLHDFPIRDEILYQYLPLSADMRVLEVGPGSGFTAFRVARQVRHLTLLDAAEGAVAELRGTLCELPNLTFVSADVAQPDLSKQMQRGFDAAFALDVFEYVANPAVCLRNLADLLRSGGELLLSFPNVPPPVGDGVTHFREFADLEQLLAQAGFRRWEIFAVRLRPSVAGIYNLLHDWPLRFYRRVRGGDRNARPQTYEATWAFRQRQRLFRYKAPLHLFWIALGGLIRIFGDAFGSEPVAGGILGRQLVIRARK